MALTLLNGYASSRRTPQVNTMPTEGYSRRETVASSAPNARLSLSASHRSSALFARPAMRPKVMPIYEDTTEQTTRESKAVMEKLPLLGQAPASSRRRTIWVPSDDTTVLTIHPGMHRDTLLDATLSMAKLSVVDDLATTATLCLAKPLIRAPSRAPLSVVRLPTSNGQVGDVHGRPTGKENVAPGSCETVATGKPMLATKRRDARPPAKPAAPSDLQMLHVLEPAEIEHAVVRQSPALERLRDMTSDYEGKPDENPDWTAALEAAMAEAINGILDHGREAREQPSGHEALRQFHAQPHFVELKRQLDHAVSHGVLSLPSASDVPRLHQDVGLRQTFVDLWADSYEPDKLLAAAELISGKKCKRNGTEEEQDQRHKHLRGFLARQLVPTLHLESVHVDDHHAAHTKAWQQTVVRSLMLTSLLDKAKDANVLRGYLFRKDSHVKSSHAMLRAVAKLAVPFVGDITGTLGYMEYRLTVKQSPLDEYDFHVCNLPTDTRDGVRLARLLDLLKEETDSAADLTTANHQKEPGEGRAIVSKQLHLPCHTRAQKMQNVQLSLSALTMAGVCVSVRAEDIVDGHREKTMSLLWTIVKGWGVRILAREADGKGDATAVLRRT